MKHMFFRQTMSADRKRKACSVLEINQHEGVKTRVSRHYIYFVDQGNNEIQNPEPPTVYIHKRIDSKSQNQELLFKTKGSFRTIHNQQSFLIHFCRSLKIQLNNMPAQVQ